ncbi:NUDIX hydrolase [Streptomyces sp. NPDC055287]
MTPAMPAHRGGLDRGAGVGDLVDHTPQSAYAHLQDSQPELFTSPPGGGTIDILRWPMASGEVVYQDAWFTLVKDRVRFPDGRPGTYIRLMPSLKEPGVAILPLLGEDVVLIEHFRHATRAWHWEIPRGGGTAGLAPAENAAKELQEEIGAAPAGELVPLGQLHPDTGILSGAVELFAARIDAVGDVEHSEGIRRARALPFATAEKMAAAGEITDVFTLCALLRARGAGLVG